MRWVLDNPRWVLDNLRYTLFRKKKRIKNKQQKQRYFNNKVLFYFVSEGIMAINMFKVNNW